MSFVRALRRVLVACVVVAVLLASAFANRAAAGTEASVSVRNARMLDTHASAHLGGETRRHYPSSPLVLHIDGVDVMAFPPATKAEARPLSVIYLHGARGRAENGCPWFRAGASSEPGIAVGFSQGSYVALDLVKARLAKFRGLVLLGAELHPNAQTLKDAGIVRIALGAGQLDHVAHASLVEEAKRLSNEGIETRFFDLGRVGHTYAVEDRAILDDAIAFAGGAD